MAVVCLLLLLSGSAAAQWEWRNPHPQGNDLWGATYAPSSTSGWAVGGAGIIIATGDGGATWAVQESGTGTFLRGVFALNASLAWAVGDDGTVLNTADGGMTWTAQPSGVTAGINQLCAASASEAWMVGDAGMILHSTNGGASWSAQNSGSGNNLNDVTFSSALNGICVGAVKTILRTTNGGGTWSSVSIGGPGSFDLIGVFFLNANLGWAAGTFGTILRTTNGGANWSRSTGVGTTSDLNDVVFLDANIGYACGEGGTLLKSTNSGVSWTSVSVSSNGLEAISATGTSIASVGVFGDIIASTGGAFSNVVIGMRSTFNAVTCAGSLDAWMVGDAGAIVATTDGGITWTQQANGLVSASLYGASAVDAQRVWICGAGGLILRTTNGGATWSPQSSSVSVALNGIDFPTPTTGFAVGLGGKIVRTTNGGANWSAIASGTLDDLSGIHMLTDSVGTVVGANGVILHTTNAGASWQRQSSFTQDALFSVTFSSDNGWICGDAGTILYTTDAGQNWDIATTNQTAPLFHIAQTSASDLAAVGDAGLILRSTDAGVTWAPERSHAMYAIYGIAVGGGTLRTCGDFGLALANGSYPTPVTFVSFSARPSKGSVHLAWETAVERNNSGFDVQRNNGGVWKSIGFVASRGDSEYRMRYSYDDVPPTGGSHRYRLRQIDADGSCAFSPEVMVEMGSIPASFGLEQNYPNPARGGTAIRVTVPGDLRADDVASLRLLVHDAAGRAIADLTSMLRSALQRVDAGGVAVLQLAAELFPRPGVYYCTLRSATVSTTRTMVIE